MDADAPHPHCPFCGLPMHFARPAPDVSAHGVLQVFDCRWCGVALNVAPGVETMQLAAPPLAPG